MHPKVHTYFNALATLAYRTVHIVSPSCIGQELSSVSSLLARINDDFWTQLSGPCLHIWPMIKLIIQNMDDVYSRIGIFY